MAGRNPGIRQLPLVSLEILRRAIGNDFLDPQERSVAVLEGVILKSSEGGDEYQGPHYKYKLWVEPSRNKICWMVLAKGLSIAQGDDRQYWTWKEEGEPCYRGPKNVLIAELEKTCRLGISGTLETDMLSPETQYQVEIMMKIRPQSHGWEEPVKLSLTLPDGGKQERSACLNVLPKDKWLAIKIGTFWTMPIAVGEIRFSLTQTDEHCKSGLVVKGVKLGPIELQPLQI